LHHEVQKFSSGTSSPGWSRKKGRKMVVCVCVLCYIIWYDGFQCHQSAVPSATVSTVT